MAEEAESFKTESQKIAQGEWKEVMTDVGEELKNLSVVEGEESKNSSTAEEGEESKNASTAVEVKPKKVKLRTSDDVIFEVESSIANQMETVQSFIEAAGVDSSVVIPLHNVCSRYLVRILEYSMEHFHVADAGALKEFDDRFVAELSSDEMKELLLAANYLDMKSFLDFLSNSIANSIKTKSVEFVREFFGIVNDYTPEEEAEYREANAWAFEGVDHD